jgi:hypothetical protein
VLQIYDIEPSECFELLRDFDLESAVVVGGNDSIHCHAELIAPVPGGEQVDVLAGPFQDAVRLNRVSTRQREAIALRGRQTNPCEPVMDRIH